MALEIRAQAKPTGAMIADRRLRLTADRARVVEDGDPEAAFLLAAPGREIAAVDAKRLKLTVKGGKVVVPKPKASKAKRRKASKPKASGGDEDNGEGPDAGDGDALPEDFPARDLLVEAGLDTLEAVAEASDEDLEAVNGIGAATVEDIRAAAG